MNPRDPLGPLRRGQRPTAASPARPGHPPGLPAPRCGRRAEQRPRPLGVPLPDRGPAPGGVQVALPVVGHGQRDDLLAASGPPNRARPGRQRRRLHQLAQPPGPFAPPGGRLRARPRPAPSPRRTRAAPPPTIRGPVCVRSRADAAAGPLRHPRRQRGAGQRGQQLGRGGPDVAAAVGQRLFQERLVGGATGRRAASRGTSAGPRPAPWPRSSASRAQAGRRVRAAAAAVSSATRSANRPSSHSCRTPARCPRGTGPALATAGRRSRAQRELPVRIQPRQPQGARSREGQRVGPQVGPGPGRVQQRREQLRAGRA